MLNQNLYSQAEDFHQQFVNAKPFKHVVLENFFQEDSLNSLIDEFPSFQNTKGFSNDAGQKRGVKGAKSNVRDFGPVFRKLDEFIQGEKFLRLMEKISGIPELCYDPNYQGAGIHENFSGKRNMIHVDFNYDPVTRYHRRLNAIIYVTEGWLEEWGGALKIYEDGWNPEGCLMKKLPCLFNRCVLFETNEISWHAVETIATPDPDISRKSITIYLYTKSRPAEEMQVPHQTIYVPGEPPKFMRENQAEVSSQEYAELKGYHNSTKSLIKSLYDRELKYSERIERMNKRINHLSKFYRLPAIGFVESKVISGIPHMNDIIINDAKIAIEPLQDIEEVIGVFNAPQVDRTMRLTISVNGREVISEIQINHGINKVPFGIKLKARDNTNISFKLKSDEPEDCLLRIKKIYFESENQTLK